MRRLFFLLSMLLVTFWFLSATSFPARLSSVDKDGDGWPDEYEEKLGADPNSAFFAPNFLGDPDQDGLDNESERDAGTDPTNPDTDGDGLSDFQEVIKYKSDPFYADTDKDGLSDLDEVIAGSDPRCPDTDGDGWLDGAEVRACSDPCDSASTPLDP